MDFVKNFKSLPSKAKNLMSLGIILALVIALPLFVWALTNLNFNLKEKAATGEPPVGTPINWSTGSVSITADDFYVVSNNKRYFEDPQYTTINPSPVVYDQAGISTSVEIVSNQYGDTLRAQIDFKSNSDKWWIEKIRLFANTENTNNWTSEYNNPIIESPLGTIYNRQGTHSMGFVDPSNGMTVAIINATNFKVIAFNEMSTNADLMIEDITITRISPPVLECESYQYKVTIKNIGSDPVYKTRVKTTFNPTTQQAFNDCSVIRDYESSNAPIPSYENELYVLPNQAYYYYDYFNPTSNAAVTITSKVDYTNTFAEQNESNNVFSKTIDVLKLYPSPEPTTAPTSSPDPTLLGDINGDGKVNIVDMGIVIENYGSTEPNLNGADVSGDGKVNIVDIGIIIDNYVY